MLVIQVTDIIRMELATPFCSNEIFKVVDGNREYLRIFLPWVDNIHGSDEINENIKNNLSALAEKSGASYVIKENDRIIGRISIWISNKATSIYEIGYWIEKDSAGKGIMTSCVREIIKIGFECLNANKIEIQCADVNIGSNRIAQKLRFKYEGTIRNAEKVYDNIYNLNVYGLLKEENFV